MSEVRTSTQGVRGYVTIDAPATRNALDGDGWRALRDAVRAFGERSEVRTIVLDSVGGVFSAGAQVDWMRAADAAELRAIGDALASFAACPKPIVARVHGPAYGGGVGLVASCDLVVASRAARFTLSEARLGVAPAIVSRHVIRRVGPARFRAWALTAQSVGTEAAFAAGLVDRVADAADLDAAINDVCLALCAAEPGALAAIKTLYPDGLDDPHAVDLLATLRARPEFAEGIAALREKRPPSWVAPARGAT